MTDPTPSRPSVRLKPKADARRIRHGHPWVFDTDLVTDRRTRALEPGSLAVLEDAGRDPVALVAVNPTSRIMARVLDADPDAQLDANWFAARLSAALAIREKLFDAPFYRLIHAEADGLPGVVIDRFGDVVVIQPNAAWAETHINALASAVAQV
ncbi:MAG: RlmI/RlmK family 23S rRNA methyltransferase, partial [Pseudomonadota bacterium]